MNGNDLIIVQEISDRCGILTYCKPFFSEVFFEEYSQLLISFQCLYEVLWALLAHKQ